MVGREYEEGLFKRVTDLHERTTVEAIRQRHRGGFYTQS